MMDTDTFLTTLYVMVDDFCKYQFPPEKTPGPRPSLTRGEVVTLALFGQWSCFLSERGFYRYASHHLRPAFPTLPYRGQFNRLMRRHYEAIVAFFRHLVAQLQTCSSRLSPSPASHSSLIVGYWRRNSLALLGLTQAGPQLLCENPNVGFKQHT